MRPNGFSAQCGLSGDETNQVHALAAICREADGFDIKFNYGMIAKRKPGELCDFCWFLDGELVGYVPLDRFGHKGEITAAVAPAFRRQGIFTRLYAAAVEQAKIQACTELLLVGYRESQSGTELTRKLGLPYKVSEYCMTASVEDIPNRTPGDITLIDVTPDHVEELSGMLAVNFPESGWGAPVELIDELSDPAKRYYLAQVSNQYIGHIGVAIGKSETYIRGVGILPEWRRKGYGKQMLAEAVRRQVADGAKQFELDVATENESALKIYKDCGFRQSNVYDYYVVF